MVAILNKERDKAEAGLWLDLRIDQAAPIVRRNGYFIFPSARDLLVVVKKMSNPPHSKQANCDLGPFMQIFEDLRNIIAPQHAISVYGALRLIDKNYINTTDRNELYKSLKELITITPAPVRITYPI